MIYVLAKLLITAGLVVLVSETAKRSALWGGLLASLPLVSFLGMIWLYLETKDARRIADLSMSIFWLVLPSLLLFVSLAGLLRRGVSFPVGLTMSTVLMLAGYGVFLKLGWK